MVRDPEERREMSLERFVFSRVSEDVESEHCREGKDGGQYRSHEVVWPAVVCLVVERGNLP